MAAVKLPPTKSLVCPTCSGKKSVGAGQCRRCKTAGLRVRYEDLTEASFHNSVRPSGVPTVFTGRYWEGETLVRLGRAAWRWREAYGPIPAGHTIIHLDTVTNDDLHQLACVTKAQAAKKAWRTQTKKECEWCGDCMGLVVAHRKYCGHQCVNESHSVARPICALEGCNKRCARVARTFCSTSCRDKYGWVKSACVQCEEVFLHIRSRPRKFCNLGCHHIHRRLKTIRKKYRI